MKMVSKYLFKLNIFAIWLLVELMGDLMWNFIFCNYLVLNLCYIHILVSQDDDVIVSIQLPTYYPF